MSSSTICTLPKTPSASPHVVDPGQGFSPSHHTSLPSHQHLSKVPCAQQGFLNVCYFDGTTCGAERSSSDGLSPAASYTHPSLLLLSLQASVQAPSALRGQPLAAWIPFVSQIPRTDGIARRLCCKGHEVHIAVLMKIQRKGGSQGGFKGWESGTHFHLALASLLKYWCHCCQICDAT